MSKDQEARIKALEGDLREIDEAHELEYRNISEHVWKLDLETKNHEARISKLEKASEKAKNALYRHLNLLEDLQKQILEIDRDLQEVERRLERLPATPVTDTDVEVFPPPADYASADSGPEDFSVPGTEYYFEGAPLEPAADKPYTLVVGELPRRGSIFSRLLRGRRGG